VFVYRADALQQYAFTKTFVYGFKPWFYVKIKLF